MIEDDGGKEIQGEDITIKGLNRGACNNDKNDNLWIQLATI